MNNKDIPFDSKYIKDNMKSLLRVSEINGKKSYIRFCTSDYSDDKKCSFDDEMTESIVSKLIKDGKLKTRLAKSKEAQQARTKEKAEVFTPSWICEYMVNSCIIKDKSITKEEANERANRLVYEDDWTKEKYYSFIGKRWMEACCGEAPYIVSRYDTTTGEDIDVYHRVGFLDRKLQLISRYRQSFDEWFNDVMIAYKNTYAYEWQGDNLFIARCNLLLTFIDYYEECFDNNAEERDIDELVDIIVNIIMKNTVQMDGLTWKKPCAEEDVYYFDWEKNKNHETAYKSYEGIYKEATEGGQTNLW